MAIQQYATGTHSPTYQRLMELVVKEAAYFAVNYSAAELNDLLSAAEGVPEDEKYKTLETAIFLDLIKPRLKGAIKLQKSEKLFENLA